MNLKQALSRLLVHVVLCAAVLYAVYPLLWVVAVALARDGIAGASGPWPWPRTVSISNVVTVLGIPTETTARFVRQLFNSIAVSLATATTALILATPAAYALARFSFVGRSAGLRTLLMTQMFPTVASALPLYLLLGKFHLLDSRTGLVLAYSSTAIPFAVFQLKSAFEAIPLELEEAAMVDGATRFGAFVRIALPAVRPALAITGLFAFMSAWNEFILAATLLSREDAFTLPVVLQRYVGEHSAAWGPFAAGSLLVSIPVMVVFYLTQKQLLSGLTAGSVKG